MTSHQAISFRSATRQDYDFAWRLYSTTIRDIAEALIGWDEIKQSASFADQWLALERLDHFESIAHYVGPVAEFLQKPRPTF